MSDNLDLPWEQGIENQHDGPHPCDVELVDLEESREVEADDEVEEGQWKEQAFGLGKVIAHKKGTRIYHTFDAVQGIESKRFAPSDTFQTVPHVEVVDEVEYAIQRFLVEREGISVVDRLCMLSPGKCNQTDQQVLGARFFGMWGLSLNTNDGDDAIQAVIAAQNANDGFARLLVAGGAKVDICDNLAFSGELMFRHQHKGKVWQKMITSIHEIVRAIPQRFIGDVQLREALKGRHVSYDSGFKMLGDLHVKNVLDSVQFKAAYNNLLAPVHTVFANDTSAWGVYNAATWGAKKGDMFSVINSTNLVDAYFRDLVGLKAS